MHWLKRIRWLRFSMRSLLVGILVLSVWLGLISARAREQDRAISKIQEIGGTVLFDFNYGDLGEEYRDKEPPYPRWLRSFISESYYANVRGVDFSSSSVTDRDLEYLAGLRCLENLALTDCPNITDAGLKVIGNLPNLRSLKMLVLDKTNITDEGLAHIAPLQQLEGLYLESTQMSDAGLTHVAKLEGLKWLGLERNRVTDAGMKLIGKSPNLRSLNMLSLNNTNISDEGLAHIAPLQQLEGLYLARTQVTDAGLPYIARFQKLVYLGLEETQVTDDVFEIIPVDRIRDLRIKGTGVSQKKAAEIEQRYTDCMMSYDRKNKGAVPSNKPIDEDAQGGKNDDRGGMGK